MLKMLRRRANIWGRVALPRPLSVSEAASILNASDAYVRRLLLTKRLFGVKIGPVWAIYPNDLEAFQRMRRQPGRPRKTARQTAGERATRARITADRLTAKTDATRLKPRRR
jgi:excisionase family DNA binding protein